MKISKILLISLLVLSIMPLGIFARGYSTVSPALDIISDSESMIKTGLFRESINFDKIDFKNAAGVSKLNSVVILSLPPITDGQLMYNGNEVSKNLIIKYGKLSNLSFIPATDASDSTEFNFRIVTNDCQYDMKCVINLLDELNYRPTVSTVEKRLLKYTTAENITLFGTLGAADPENDSLIYEITKMPEKGVLVLSDRSYGDFYYTPIESFCGRDSFMYRVRDCYGNYSEEAKVTINVEEHNTGTVFSDMLGHWAHNAALKATESGIMESRFDDGVAVFEPYGTVGKAEFVAAVMCAAGYRITLAPEKIGFADEDEIPGEYKGYIAAALEWGFINGEVTANGTFLYPCKAINRAEAAVIINNILKPEQLSVKPVFSDITDVPAWAEGALYAMNTIGIMNGTGEGYISPLENVNRAQTAQMVISITQYSEN